MPVKNYVNINGRAVAEHTGGVRTSYLTDALGSITATVNSSQAVVNTYRWKPFGERLAKTGAGADPTLGWVGAYGYRRTQRSRSEYYMLARHYDSIGGRWTTVDPLWPEELAYLYCGTNPIARLDPSGLQNQFVGDWPPKGEPPLREAPPRTLPAPNKCSPGRISPQPKIGPGPGCRQIIIEGGIAAYELYDYLVNGQTGTYTGFGHSLGVRCFPGKNFVPAEDKYRLARCQAEHARYRKLCSNIDCILDLTSPSDCVEAVGKVARASACIKSRTWVINNCDKNPPKGWRHRPCGHMYAVCYAKFSMCQCIKKLRGAPCWVDLSGMIDCKAAEKECRWIRLYCNLYGGLPKPFEPLPWHTVL